jgi:formate hydrogenlyase subunit 4
MSPLDAVSLALNLLTVAVLPFLFAGFINRVKARWAGRRGARLVQPWFDFIRLWSKEEVVSTVSTMVFRIGPPVNAAAVLTAACLVPLAGRSAIFSFEGDFIVFAYLLAAGKFFSVLASLDTGSSFEGMGASREAIFSGIAEPAFFIILSSLAAMNGVTSFRDLVQQVYLGTWLTGVIVALCATAFFLMLLIEGCRVPVDDPNTHLELTMIHEVMVLDNSGPGLGLTLYAAWLKLVLFAAIIAGVLLPPDLELQLFAPVYLLIQVAIAALVGTLESVMARLRMVHLPQFGLLVNALALLVFTVIQLSAFGAPR